ncbi:MAG: secretin and TonB N-terminal domain-containing protein, partial [Halanaerobiaceae bacterium]
MRKYKSRNFVTVIFILMLLVLVAPTMSLAEESGGEEDDIVTVTVRDASIRDVLMMLTEQSGINLVPDESVQGEVSLDLKDVPIQEALNTLTIAYGYEFEPTSDNVYMVSQEGFEAEPEINVKDDELYLQVEKHDVREVLNSLAEIAGIDIIMDRSVEGEISANLQGVPFEKGLVSVLQAHGFNINVRDDIYRVYSTGGDTGEENDLNVSYVDDELSVNVEQADLGELLRTISQVTDINIILFGGVRDRIDIKLDNVSVEEALDMILGGTRFTYREHDGVYMIGERNLSTPSSRLLTVSEEIVIDYLEAETVPNLLPDSIDSGAIEVMEEKNSILVTGSQPEIDRIKEYIDTIDTKVPQVVVEALIVEVSDREEWEKGVEFDVFGSDEGGGQEKLFESPLGQLTYKSVVDLPDNFNAIINNMIEDGVANVKARPNITTLNGKEAALDVGMTHYYQIEETDSEGETTVDYDSVKAGVTLDVTPWVSGEDEINLELHPTVSDIGGASSGDGPPDMTNRELETSVRVKDESTIVIGGLIQDVSSETESKVPFLGDLPYLGNLFKNTDGSLRSTELIMFITPHILDKGEEDVSGEMDEMIENTEN